MEERRFRSLRIGQWRQFSNVVINFDPRLTILTGANASGKSTILTLLAKHFEWSRSYSAAPKKTKGGTRWAILQTPLSAEQTNRVGTLEYSDDFVTDFVAPIGDSMTAAQYDVSFQARREVAGVFLTSHRAVAGNYARVETIPALFGDSEQIFEQFTGVVRNRWMGAWGGKTPQLALKESLIAAAAFGEGNASIERNQEAWDVWLGFTELLKSVFPASLGYVGVRVREAEVIIETTGDDFIIDEVSGGLSALIEMAWQIFLRSRTRRHFTVLIDEPENHLHPSLQREVLPTLLRAFPSVQFVVATHSPFVVTATPESAVYVLDYDESHRVYSRRLDYANKAASADATLREVLGLESTMPTWAEDRFASILAEHLGGAVDQEQLASLREALRANGLASEFPTALLAAIEQEDVN